MFVDFGGSSLCVEEDIVCADNNFVIFSLSEAGSASKRKNLMMKMTSTEKKMMIKMLYPMTKIFSLMTMKMNISIVKEIIVFTPT